jgi:hypothetical protein
MYTHIRSLYYEADTNPESPVVSSRIIKVNAIFITEPESVYCAVRAASLNSNQVKACLLFEASEFILTI